MGLLAAVGEMVLQSHEPGVLRALPALAQDMYPSGCCAIVWDSHTQSILNLNKRNFLGLSCTDSIY